MAKILGIDICFETNNPMELFKNGFLKPKIINDPNAVAIATLIKIINQMLEWFF